MQQICMALGAPATKNEQLSAALKVIILYII